MIKQAESLAKKTTKIAQTELPKQLKMAETAKVKIREIISSLHEGDAVNDDLRKALEDGEQSIGHLKKFLSDRKSAKPKQS